jgi:poly-gamma-glutamate synthesis protein (capsule biosynthesis protein)
MARLGLTGDVMLGRLVDEVQRTRRADPAAVWGDVLDRLRGLDGLLVNLECAVSARGRQWRRTRRAFHFRAHPDWAIPALQRAGVDVAALANNHLLDYEEVALLDTLDHLDSVDIAHTGAGETIATAREPAVVSVDGLDVAVVAATDNTPEYAAGPDNPGVVHLEFDPDSRETRAVFGTMLAAARARDPDLLVASIHSGPNMVTEPDETRRRFAQWLAERVDLVHGHSAHVVQGIEVHDGTPICHDCGDFVDDYRVDPKLRNDRSFLFVADVTPAGVEQLTLYPTEIREYAVYEAGADAAAWLRETMRERSAAFGTTLARENGTLVWRR